MMFIHKYVKWNSTKRGHRGLVRSWQPPKCMTMEYSVAVEWIQREVPQGNNLWTFHQQSEISPDRLLQGRVRVSLHPPRRNPKSNILINNHTIVTLLIKQHSRTKIFYCKTYRLSDNFERYLYKRWVKVVKLAVSQSWYYSTSKWWFSFSWWIVKHELPTLGGIPPRRVLHAHSLHHDIIEELKWNLHSFRRKGSHSTFENFIEKWAKYNSTEIYFLMNGSITRQNMKICCCTLGQKVKNFDEQTTVE